MLALAVTLGRPEVLTFESCSTHHVWRALNEKKVGPQHDVTTQVYVAPVAPCICFTLPLSLSSSLGLPLTRQACHKHVANLAAVYRRDVLGDVGAADDARPDILLPPPPTTRRPLAATLG